MGSSRRSEPRSHGGPIAYFLAFVVVFGAGFYVARRTSMWMLDRVITDERSGRLLAAVLVGLLALALITMTVILWRGVDTTERLGAKSLLVTVFAVTLLPVAALPGRRANSASERAFERRYPGFLNVYLFGVMAVVGVWYAVHRFGERRVRRQEFSVWPLDASDVPLDEPGEARTCTSIAGVTASAKRLLEQRPEVAAVNVAWDGGRAWWPVRTVTREGVEDVDPSQLDASPRERHRVEAARTRWLSSGSRPVGRRRRRWRRR